MDAYKAMDQQYAMAKAILTFQAAAKKAMAGGAVLDDVVNVPARTTLMRARFEEGYMDVIDGLITSMTDEIEATTEQN